jgi:hypothetical protein
LFKDSRTVLRLGVTKLLQYSKLTTIIRAYSFSAAWVHRDEYNPAGLV